MPTLTFSVLPWLYVQQQVPRDTYIYFGCYVFIKTMYFPKAENGKHIMGNNNLLTFTFVFHTQHFTLFTSISTCENHLGRPVLGKIVHSDCWVERQVKFRGGDFRKQGVAC